MGMSPGMWLVVVGLALAGVGLAVLVGAFDWFGHLPGDIRIERGDTRIYIPVTSMIVVSLVLTLVLNVVARFLR